MLVVCTNLYTICIIYQHIEFYIAPLLDKISTECNSAPSFLPTWKKCKGFKKWRVVCYRSTLAISAPDILWRITLSSKCVDQRQQS